MEPKIIIRRFRPSDEADVEQLWNQQLPHYQPWNEPSEVIRRKTRMNDGLFFVAELKERVVATVIAGYDGTRGWIYSLAVDADHQQQGIGRRIMQHAERALQAQGCPKVNLQVRATNADVVPVCEHLGYEVEPRVSLGKPLEQPDVTRAIDPVPTIRISQNITLTDIRLGDKANYLKYLNETDQFNRFIWLIPYPYSEQDADEWLTKSLLQTFEQDRSRQWAIRERRGELIGGVGLCGVTVGEKAEIGYWLAKPFWGRGIMPAVVGAVCQHAFAEYHLIKLFARVLAENDQSERVLIKAGFQREGTLRRQEYRDGTAFDVHYYGMVRDRRDCSTSVSSSSHHIPRDERTSRGA